MDPIADRADAPEVLELPPLHLELTWRALGHDDAEALHGLLRASEEHDRSPRVSSLPEVRELFEGSWRTPRTDTLGGFDHDGVLRAFAMAEVRPDDERTVRAFLRGTVHPQWRGRGIGRAVLAWMEGRGRQLLAATGKTAPARLAVYVDEDARDQRRLYAAAGFSPVRWYTTMRRDLRAPLPEVAAPDGVRVLPWSDELDDAALPVHNEVFADHWGSEPQSPETWRQHRTHFAPGWSFVAVDRDGAVVGYTLAGRYEQDWPVLGYTCGYTDLLGVRRAWRGRRVAVALLTRAMEAFRADGMEYAVLTVDNDNPTGAHGLYARLGYEAVHGEVLYSVEI
ncbi:GNAT family N-acetyltransferase [Cellulomonas sp. APG4]|uniref:GNAT family N-acetyltransferase n=1 Tax=Cellulomonas sp. APG4 TaxID=1538656 RepID=UPI00137970E9|nr:GNAT family N-acetyltransferase [Cellulomonas sp. APG4]NCT90009.1 GNAT family N-acetyltransferase [Cellulomonas sp. APG4]